MRDKSRKFEQVKLKYCWGNVSKSYSPRSALVRAQGECVRAAGNAKVEADCRVRA